MSAVVALDTLLAARTLWHAGRSAAIAVDGEPTGHAALDALLPQGGWPRRALTELLLPADGVGELALLLPTLARCTQAGERVVLVAPPYLPYAPAWQAAGVDLAQLRIVEAGPRDALWAFEQCLRSGTCAAVLGWPQQADARALRRLQVAADTGQCLGFALRERRHLANPSPAALRLEAVRAERGIAWQVRKCRGGPVPAMPFVAGVDQEPSHLAIDVPARREVAAPSPASGGRGQAARAAPPRGLTERPACYAGADGLGWGPCSRDTTSRASGAPPSAFGTFPRERGKGETVPGPRQDPSRVVIDRPACYAGPDGLGWGQASRDATLRASGAPPSAFGTFPRERGKGKAVPAAAHAASQETGEVASLRPIAASGTTVGTTAAFPAIASPRESGQGSDWRPEQPGMATLATIVPNASSARAFAGTARRVLAHPQHELQFAPAPTARD